MGSTVSQRSRPGRTSSKRSAYRGKDMTIQSAKRAAVIYRTIGLLSLVLIVVAGLVFRLWLVDERAGSYAIGHAQGLEDAGGSFRKVKLPTGNLALIGTSTDDLNRYANEYGVPGATGRITLTNARLVGVQQPLGQLTSSVAVVNACYLKPVKPKPINYSVRITMTTQDVTIAKPDWVVSSIALVGRDCR